jgi:signal transduction histidine kinase
VYQRCCRLLIFWGLCLCALVPTRAYSQSKEERHIDSLRQVLPAVDGMDRFEVLFELFRLNLSIDRESAETYVREANQIAEIERDTLAMVKANNALGFLRKEKGQPRLAIPYFERALVLARKKNIRTQIKYLLNNLGTANVLTANYAKALDYHLESLKLREEDKDTTSIVVALNNIGVLYQDLNDYDNALTYFKRNYDLNLQSNKQHNFQLCLVNLADVSNSLGQYNEAKKYTREAFSFCSDNPDCSKRVIALAHSSMGYAHLYSEEYSQAEKEFFIATNLFTELKLADRASSYSALALVRFKMGDYQDALDKLTLAQKLAEELEIPKYRLKNYQLFADIYTKLNDYKRATEYQKMYIVLNDEIYNADLIKNIALVQAEHQEAENLRTIAARDQEIINRDEVLNLQKKQFLFLGVIAALVTVLAIVFYRAQRRQARSNELLEKVNYQLEAAQSTIERKNQELIRSNTELDNHVKDRTRELFNSNEAYKKVNEELDNFIYKTSHDIRGPLTSLKGITHLAIREARDESVVEYLNKLDLTADKLNRILTRLQIINQINHANLNPDLIDFTSMVDEILAVERKRGIPPRMAVNIQIAPGIIIFSDKALLQIVLDNLIDNAIKFYNDSDRKEPFVNVTISGGDEGVVIKVLDNGIGLKNIQQNEVFRMFVRASERSETGGIGLYLAKLSTEKLGGNIDLNVTAEEYTEFVVTLPPDLRVILSMREEKERELRMERLKLQQRELEATQQNSGATA